MKNHNGIIKSVLGEQSPLDDNWTPQNLDPQIAPPYSQIDKWKDFWEERWLFEERISGRSVTLTKLIESFKQGYYTWTPDKSLIIKNIF
jgi:hypothetical protein